MLSTLHGILITKAMNDNLMYVKFFITPPSSTKLLRDNLKTNSWQRSSHDTYHLVLSPHVEYPIDPLKLGFI